MDQSIRTRGSKSLEPLPHRPPKQSGGFFNSEWLSREYLFVSCYLQSAGRWRKVFPPAHRTHVRVSNRCSTNEKRTLEQVFDFLKSNICSVYMNACSYEHMFKCSYVHMNKCSFVESGPNSIITPSALFVKGFFVVILHKFSPEFSLFCTKEMDEKHFTALKC